MPKRKRDINNSDDYLLKKIRKLEKKIKKRHRKKSSSTSTDGSDASLSLHKDNETAEPVGLINLSADINVENEIGLSSPPEIQNEIPSLQTGNSETADIIIDPTMDVPSTSTAPSEPVVVLDENILELLGASPSKDKSYSSPIQAELAIRWENIATTGLSKDIKKELLGKYFLPANCLKIGAPKLNLEIKAALSDTLAKKDSIIETKQNQKAIAISCIGQALTKIFASEYKDPDVIKYLIDASRLLCDSQYIDSMSRRSFVTSTIKKDIKDHLFNTEIDSHLFGEGLTDTLKTAKAINKSGTEMKTTPPPKPSSQQPRSLNVRPPLPSARQAGVGRKSTSAMQPRRYQAPPPPPRLMPAPQSYQMGYRPLPPAPQQRSRGRMPTRR